MNRTAFFDSIRRSIFRGRLSQSQVDGLNFLLDRGEGLKRAHFAYILATIYHETAHTMQPIAERGKRRYFDRYDGRLGNDKPGDGYRYRGRGYVQLTGKANYRKAGDRLRLPLVEKPDLALDPDVSWKITKRGMLEGWFTGKKLGDFKSYRYMRQVVNGFDRADLIAGYAAAFEEALKEAEIQPKIIEKAPPTTGKPAVRSTTNLAAGTAALSTLAGASRDARTVIDNLGIPPWVLVVVTLVALAWIFRERIRKAYRDGV